MNNKILLILILVVVSVSLVTGVVLAVSSMYQRCEANENCIIGEYVFEDDGHTATTTDDLCKITINDPSDNVIANQVNMSDKDDGWYYYTTSTLSIEGLHRTLICCHVGDSDEQCLDKTFIVGSSFYSTSTIASSTWEYSSRTLTDYATSSITDAVWDEATSTMTTAGSIGKHLVDNIDDKISEIAASVWSYTGSALDTAGNAISKVWSFATRKLTSRQIGSGSEYMAGVTESGTVTQVANEADQTTIKYDVDLVRQTTFDFAGFADSGTTLTLVDSELDQPDDYWNNYRLRMMSGSNIGEEQTVSDFDAVSDTITVSSAFSNAVAASDKYVLLHEDRLVYQIWNYSTRTLSAIGSLAADIWNNTFAPTRRLTDKTLTGGGSLATESYIDTATSTIIAELDQLDTLETKLDTVDSVVDLIRASQQLDYTVELSDMGEMLTASTTRVKLTILNYESVPVDANAIPTITIYDALRATATSSAEMTKLSNGVYEFTYTVPTTAVSGLWETVVSVDLGGATALTLNDYWEVEGSPAQVIINSMSDTTVPSISANVTISNEGASGYEYQYEWCVVTTQDNQCGGGDDIDYALAAKYLAAGEDYTADLSLTVPNTGDYWFKVVVYYGTEVSGASRTFTATEEEEEEAEEEAAPGGGGSSVAGSTCALCNIYNKLLEIQDELGYNDTGGTVYKDLSNTRYSLGALPDQLSEPLYTVLTGISSDIQAIGGDTAYSLNDIYEISKANADDLSYIVNKTAELRAMAEINKTLVSMVANNPIIQTWWTEGSIILNIMAINPPDAARTIAVKEYLPEEIRAEHIIEIEEGLELRYDSASDTYFVSGEVKLGPGERKIFKVEAEDVFTISEQELSALSEQAETLMEPLKGTSYFAQASILKSEIDANLQSVSRAQIEGPSNIEKRISVYKNNQKDLQKVKENIEALKILVSEASGKGGVLGSLFGVSITMTWAIIIIVVVGVAVLMILLWTILMRSRALEYHISGGRRLKAPPVVNVKKQARKIKGGLITYFLPPFGKPMVDLKQMVKMIKILIVVGVLVVLILLGMRFIGQKNTASNISEILAPDYTEKEITQMTNESGVDVEMDLSFEEETEPGIVEKIPEQAKPSYQNFSGEGKLKITETGIGWLYVRLEPSTDSKILDTVNVGDEFDYTDEQDGWYKITLDDETEGWVFGEYVEIISNF